MREPKLAYLIVAMHPYTIRIRRNLRLLQNRGFLSPSLLSPARAAARRSRRGAIACNLRFRKSDTRTCVREMPRAKRGENSLCFSTWRHRFLILPRIKHRVWQPPERASPSRRRETDHRVRVRLSRRWGGSWNFQTFVTELEGGQNQLPKHAKWTLRQLTHRWLMSRRTTRRCSHD